MSASCCARDSCDAQFDRERAADDLTRYRSKGPDKTTRLLLEALHRAGVEGASLLDVGGGVGVVHHELLDAGVASAVHVDAADAYVRAAEEEAARRGHAARVSFLRGDFVDVGENAPPADVVTLDRVICCYRDMPRLVAASASKARRLWAATYPRDTWLPRLLFVIDNAQRRLKRSDFRTYVHATDAIDASIRREGLAPLSIRDTLLWRIAVYARSSGTG